MREHRFVIRLAIHLAEQGHHVWIEPEPGNLRGWDHHARINTELQKKCAEIDRPVAALLRDLKQRGLLDETLVLWGGEFGRTPVSEAGDGRDHNHYGFTLCLAGGGVKGGVAHGATDEFGFRAVDGWSEEFVNEEMKVFRFKALRAGA